MPPLTAPPRPPARQQGAVAVAFILLSVVLLGFVTLAMDVGRLYVSKTELQNAADSCALSASAALTGANANQLTAAEDFGIAAGTRNLYRMQSDPVVVAPDRDITFSSTLNGGYQTRTAVAGNALNMRYVRCTLTEASIPTLMIHVVNLLPGQNIGPTTLNASAVASLEPSISNCAMPLGICEADIIGRPAGTWIQGILQPGGAIQGAFKWIQYPGFERNNQLAELITGQGAGQCSLTNSDTVSSHPGCVNSLLYSWNTRLGIYRPSGPTPTEAYPDWTGWVYDPTQFPAQANAMPDFLQKRAQATPKHQNNSQYNLPNPNQWATDAQFQSGQDRRLVVGPIVDCPGLGSNGTTTIKGWACVLMLNPVFNCNGDTMYLEYRGRAEDPASGCVTSGAPGGPAASGPKVPTLVQ